MAPPSPTIDQLRRERATGPRLVVERVKAPKPTPEKRRVPNKAAISPAAYKALTHRTPEAALFARLSKKATKTGSPPIGFNVSENLGAVSVAEMAAAARQARLNEEIRVKKIKGDQRKLDAMGGRMPGNNPFSRPFK